MYGWLWRHLPGQVALRVLQVVLLVAVVVAVCFLWVFPAVAPHLPVSQQTVGEAAPAGP